MRNAKRQIQIQIREHRLPRYWTSLFRRDRRSWLISTMRECADDKILIFFFFMNDAIATADRDVCVCVCSQQLWPQITATNWCAYLVHDNPRLRSPRHAGACHCDILQHFGTCFLPTVVSEPDEAHKRPDHRQDDCEVKARWSLLLLGRFHLDNFEITAIWNLMQAEQRSVFHVWAMPTLKSLFEITAIWNLMQAERRSVFHVWAKVGAEAARQSQSVSQWSLNRSSTNWNKIQSFGCTSNSTSHFPSILIRDPLSISVSVLMIERTVVFLSLHLLLLLWWLWLFCGWSVGVLQPW